MSMYLYISCPIDIMKPSSQEPLMSLLRSLDPSFPIERQIAIEAGPVVLANLFTLDRADEQAFLDSDRGFG